MTTRTLVAALLALGLAGPALAAEPSVLLKGDAGQTATITLAELKALPQASVTLIHEGKTTTYDGARLAAVLARVGAPLGKALRGPALAEIVVVKASDGYRVALSLGDVDPGMRKDPVILADREDGEPLGADGPLRLAVGGDLRPARSARNVVEIDVVKIP